MKYYIATSLQAEELYAVCDAVDYMVAIKKLKEAECNITKMLSCDFYGNTYDLVYSVLLNIRNIDFISDTDDDITVNILTSKQKAKEVEKLIAKNKGMIKESITVKKYGKNVLQMKVNVEMLYMYRPFLHPLADFVINVNAILKEEKQCILT